MAGAAEGIVTVLDIRNVSVRFGGIAALSEVSLTVQAGAVTGLIGPNGAGKTTLFDVINGLKRPDRGQVLIDGQDVTHLGPHRRARLGLARTFQRLELFGSLSAADNVRVGLEAGRRRFPLPLPDQETRHAVGVVTALLERVGVADVAGTSVNSLSTGTARLVELARALSIGPRVLMLDEPCSGQDDRETSGLGRLLRELAAEGRAIMLVEHNMDIVLEFCDVVHVLDFGRIIASGTPAEVRRDPGVQAAYLGRVSASGDASVVGE
jgi:branched-chain amino acid transport system ATP-binding protein